MLEKPGGFWSVVVYDVFDMRNNEAKKFGHLQFPQLTNK